MSALLAALALLVSGEPPLPNAAPTPPTCPEGTTLHQDGWTGALAVFAPALEDDLLGLEPPVQEGRVLRWECRRGGRAAHGPVRVVLPLGEVLLEGTRDEDGRLDGPVRYRSAYERVYAGLPEILFAEVVGHSLPSCDRMDLSFRAGVLEGPLRCYRRGVLLVSGQLKRGRPHGEWRFADVTGAVVGTNVVQGGSGHWIHWDAEGRVVWSGRLRKTRWQTLIAQIRTERSTR